MIDSEPSPKKKVLNRRYQSCKRKIFYDTYWDAAFQAAIARERTDHENIHPYKCHFCPGWHQGHRTMNGNKIHKRKH